MENICIDDTATVKIIDFGTAFQFGPQHTMARGCVGTEALMSPEALSRISYDAEANDVWGVGVLLYSMLHLEFPWKAAVKSDINFKRFEEHSADLRDKFTEGYGELITKLLSIDPQHRISMKELNEELTKTIPHHISCDEKLHRRTMRVCGSKIAKLLSKR
jgi:MAP/microtubule affinity-regulating kinase